MPFILKGFSQHFMNRFKNIKTKVIFIWNKSYIPINYYLIHVTFYYAKQIIINIMQGRGSDFKYSIPCNLKSKQPQVVRDFSSTCLRPQSYEWLKYSSASFVSTYSSPTSSPLIYLNETVPVAIDLVLKSQFVKLGLQR